MKKKILGIVMVLALFIIAPVSAKEINNFHTTAGDNVSFKDVVKGDSAIAGNLVDIIGNIDGIGFIAGNTVNVNGTLEYGFVAGNNVNINGNILKNVYAAGNNVIISSDAKIERDVFIAANEVVLSGQLNRDVSLGASKVTIKSDAKINGNVTIETNNLVVENGASITGTLKYNKDAKTNLSGTASIGKVVMYDGHEKDDSSSPVFDTVISILNMLVVFAVISALLPKVCDKTTLIYSDSKKYLKNFGIGLLILFCTPIIGLLLLISNVGTNLGLILLVLYVICIYLSFIASGFVLGDLIITKLFKFDINSLFVGCIGIVLLKLLMLIPGIGGLVSIIALAIGLATIGSLVIVNDKEENKTKEKIVEAKIETKKQNKKTQE